MDIKLVCRLCCANNEVKHCLFTPNEGGVSLAEELRILTDIEITKEDHLSESICANCYRVNTFFKEFRKNCSDVNDYLKKLKNSEKSLPCDIIIKEEKLDDYEDQSADPVGNQQEDVSRHPDMPYPVALVHSVQKNNDLNELRSNFLAVKRSREQASSSTMPEDQNGPSNVPMRRTEKRKNDGADDSVRRQRPRVDIPTNEDLLNHVVKQEEIDISESLVEDTTFHAEESLDDPWTPHESHHSLLSGNNGGHSSMITGRRPQLYDFRLKLMDQPSEDFVKERKSPRGGRPLLVGDWLRLSGRHFPKPVPATASKDRPQRKCFVCQHTARRESRRRDTRVMCIECNKPLCLLPCFEEYHSLKKF